MFKSTCISSFPCTIHPCPTFQSSSPPCQPTTHNPSQQEENNSFQSTRETRQLQKLIKLHDSTSSVPFPFSPLSFRPRIPPPTSLVSVCTKIVAQWLSSSSVCVSSHCNSNQSNPRGDKVFGSGERAPLSRQRHTTSHLLSLPQSSLTGTRQWPGLSAAAIEYKSRSLRWSPVIVGDCRHLSPVQKC